MNKWFSEKTDYIVKEFVKILLTVLLFSLANKWLSVFFDKYFVDKVIGVLYKDQFNLFETFLMILLGLYTMYLLIAKYSDTIYKLRFYTIFLLSFIFVIYLKCRYEELYSFTRVFKTNDSDGIAVLDIPFSLLLITILIFVVNRLNTDDTIAENDLILDLPLTLLENDEYDRKEVYEGLLEQIAKINFKENRSFCLGITNSWGEGKTSFLNFLNERLIKDKNTIVIEFNPWLSINSDNLTLDFFHTLNEELSKYIHTGSDLRKYANNLTAINSAFNPFKYLPNSWVGDKAHKSSFNDINEIIKKTGKRIFVFVDDLDRLDNKEVFNLLRTVRNTANFGNVHFIVPFDKSYTINAIKENKIHDPEKYLKKIFDVEIVLPPVPKERLQQILFILFTELFTKKLIVTTEQKDNFLIQLNSLVNDIGYVTARRAKYSTITHIMFECLKNKRDIIRFYNALNFTLKKNYEWVYLPDLIILELIKLYDNKSYSLLYENDLYLSTKTDERGRQYFFLNEDGNDQDVVGQIMNRRVGGFQVNDSIDDGYVKDLIHELFRLPDANDFMAQYALAFKSNFNNYFQYRENGIKYSEIDDLINGRY